MKINDAIRIKKHLKLKFCDTDRQFVNNLLKVILELDFKGCCKPKTNLKKILHISAQSMAVL